MVVVVGYAALFATADATSDSIWASVIGGLVSGIVIVGIQRAVELDNPKPSSPPPPADDPLSFLLVLYTREDRTAGLWLARAAGYSETQVNEALKEAVRIGYMTPGLDPIITELGRIRSREIVRLT